MAWQRDQKTDDFRTVPAWTLAGTCETLIPMRIANQDVPAGTRCYIDLPLPPLYTHTSVAMPVHVINGKRNGPVLVVTAAIHGDEINGIEIIRQLLASRGFNRLKGTLITVPVVNVYGFISGSRYLPDRRDLNRSFPGSERGSMASRLANIFMSDIVTAATHMIDLHTGAAGRDNLPQVRYEFGSNSTVDAMAEAFGAPVILNSSAGKGTLRAAVGDLPYLLYEAGEALRFNQPAITAGVNGIVNVMRYLEMLPPLKNRSDKKRSVVAEDSSWLRAQQSGILRATVDLGSSVESGTILGVVADPFGELETDVVSNHGGIVVGISNNPLVHEGEALFHVAKTGAPGSDSQTIREIQEELEESHEAGDPR